MIYLTSDIHGCLKEFKKLLEYIRFGKDDHLYIIGDVLGRGDDPISLLLYVMEHENMTLLMGNHEQAFLWNMDENTGPFSDEEVRHFWLSHSGPQVLEQYEALAPQKRIEVLDYVKSCPMYMILGKNILVHAGLDVKNSPTSQMEDADGTALKSLMESQKSFKMLWQTKEFYCEPMVFADPQIRVFFGHMFSLIIRQDRGEPLDSTEIWKDANRIGLDCGYAFGGKMVMYCLDTDEEHYLTSSGEFYTKYVSVIKK